MAKGAGMSDLIVAAPSGISSVNNAFRTASSKGSSQRSLVSGPVASSGPDHTAFTSPAAVPSGSGSRPMGLGALVQAGNVLQGMQLLARSAASDPNPTNLSEQQIMYNVMAGQVNMLVATATANGVSSDVTVPLAKWTSTTSILISLSDLEQAAQSVQSTMARLNEHNIASSLR